MTYMQKRWIGGGIIALWTVITLWFAQGLVQADEDVGESGWIPVELKTQVNELLANEAGLADFSETELERGLSPVHVDMQGQEAHLTGTVASDELRQRAEDLVDNMYGITDTHNDILVLQEDTALQEDSVRHYDFTYLRAVGSEVTLRGEVPDEATKDFCDATASESFDVVNNELTITEGNPRSGYRDAIQTALTSIPDLLSGRAELREGSLSIYGEVADETTRQALDDGVPATLSTEHFRGVVELTVAAPTEAVQANNCDEQFAELLTQPINFRSGSAVITPDSSALLDSLAEAAATCEGMAIQIDGHTDDRGGDASNQRLSAQRAEAVVAALGRRDVDPNLLTATGYGEANPIATNETNDGRARNRRIEMRVLRERTE